MVHKGKDFRRPLAYNDPRVSDIKLHVIPYKQLEDNPTLFTKGSASLEIKFKDIITHVNLTIDVESAKFGCDHEAIMALQSTVDKLCQPPNPIVPRPRREQHAEDDGRRVVLSEPAVAHDPSTRRSSRVRKVITHECQ